jgi:hypothetical protein
MDEIIRDIKLIGKKHLPVYTVWNPKTVHKTIALRKKSARRSYKIYLKTGDVRQLRNSQSMITNFDFD